MSCYVGNEDECPACKLTYRKLHTGFSYQDVWLMFFDDSDDTDDWKYKTRGVILGKWHQIKQEMWTEHIERCEG